LSVHSLPSPSYPDVAYPNVNKLEFFEIKAECLEPAAI